jgi:L-asparaginase II
MRAHPELIGGVGQTDTELMRALPGWIAKGGAEGLLCAASPDGLGVALKSEDGIGRGHRPALASFLRQLGLVIPDGFARVPVRNAHGEVVGEIVSNA